MIPRPSGPIRSHLGGLLCCWLLAVALPAFAAAPGPIEHGPRELPRVALTFDLCQKPGHPAGFDAKLVAILERNHAAATFFAGGDWMRTHPEAIRRLAAVSTFELGSHSWSHPYFRSLDAAAIATQLDRTRDEMHSRTGRTPALFRFPYGTWDPRSLQLVNAAGYRAIQWDVVTGDPDPKVSAAGILRTVHRHARNGSIIIMHANGRGRHTAEALQGVIDDLRGRGFSLVTVSELLTP
jgi:peptidoglycan-N-acetylglucosamine deacetylase